MTANNYSALVKPRSGGTWKPIVDNGVEYRATKAEVIVRLTHLSNFFRHNEYRMVEVKNA